MATRSSAESSIDRYVVLEYLAEGGMGAIYLGKKLGAGGFEKEVVLKQLLPEFTQQPEFIDLFLREARLSATLDHANIIHTIDLVTAGDEHFIVMEYLDGADLRTLLKRAKRRNQRISAGAAIFVAREMLSALAYAHNKLGDDGRPLRLIHRDISPSNILISSSGEVKLTDFGIAKASTHNSVFYRVKGKVGYMSPEQARSEPLDARGDLYSLAVCLYEIITGERLFIDAGLTVGADEMYAQRVPAVSEKVPGLPQELDDVMARALAVNPARRYQSAGSLQEALIRCAHRHGLMMSAPKLAAHLRKTCGDPRSWRDEAASMSSDANPGTEIYEHQSGTEALIVSEVDLVQISEEGSSFDRIPRKREPKHTALTHLTELKNVELTSMLHLGADDHAGASPLVDLNVDSDKLMSSSGLSDSGLTSNSGLTTSAPNQNLHRQNAPEYLEPSGPGLALPAGLSLGPGENWSAGAPGQAYDSESGLDPVSHSGMDPHSHSGMESRSGLDADSGERSRPGGLVSHSGMPSRSGLPSHSGLPSRSGLPASPNPGPGVYESDSMRSPVGARGDNTGLPRGVTVGGPEPGRQAMPEATEKPKGSLLSWILLMLFLAIGIALALGIGLTGPNIDLDEASSLEAAEQSKTIPAPAPK